MFAKICFRVLVWGLVHFVDQEATSRFSTQSALNTRRKLEMKLLELYQAPQRGWRKKVTLDEAGIKYLQIVLKSKYLGDKLYPSTNE